LAVSSLLALENQRETKHVEGSSVALSGPGFESLRLHTKKASANRRSFFCFCATIFIVRCSHVRLLPKPLFVLSRLCYIFEHLKKYFQYFVNRFGVYSKTNGTKKRMKGQNKRAKKDG